MKRTRPMVAVSLMILCALLHVVSANPAEPSGKRVGKISGVVLDPNQARIAGAVVTVRNSKVERRVKSGEAGEFEVILPGGVYQLTVESNGFCRFEGESLKVKPRETEMINIHMKIGPCGPHYS